MQAKSHELPLPQVQVPLAHTAWQLLLSPWQVTWQGGALQTNRQSSPAGQAQVPFLQPPTTRPPQAAASASAKAATTTSSIKTAAKRPAPKRIFTPNALR